MKNTLLVILYLFVLSLFLRLPYFFRDVIDWDESTYILMGQSLLDGYDPDLDYWHIRAYPYTLFISVFGKSILSIRFAGTLCIALIALFTYVVGNRLWDHRTALLGGTLSTFLLILLPSGQATMSEHIALVPFVGALAILVTQKWSLRILFFVGSLMAIASLIRMNLAYVSIIIGIFLLLVKSTDTFKVKLGHTAVYGAGGLFILALSYISYASVGQGHLWLSMNFLAGLSYADSQASMLETLKYHIQFMANSIVNFKRMMLGVSALLWIGGVAGIVLILNKWKSHDEEKRRGFILLLLFLFGTWLSILKGGAAYPHYLIQLVPFMALTAAVFISFMGDQYAPRSTVAVVVIALILSLKPIVGGYQLRAIQIRDDKALYDGPSYVIAEYLNQENSQNEPVFLLEKHIVYWLINTAPISKSTVHPSNIAKPYLLEHIVGPGTTPEMEMSRILEKRPKFIVKSDTVKYLQDAPEANRLLESAVASQYELAKEVGSLKIYRRL